MTQVELVSAARWDIPFIMVCERRPGYEGLVGRWPEERHAAALRDRDFACLLASGRPGGFAILRDRFLGFPNLYLKRIALRDADRGFGKRFLESVTDWVFGNTAAHRFWLEVVETSMRAAHVYRSLGWIEEGRVREAFVERDSTRGFYLQISLLRPEWQARRAQGMS